MRTNYIYIFLILSSLRISAQDVFTTNSGQPISFGTSFVDLQVNGLDTLINSTYGIEKVCLDITHGYLEDLTLTIVTPGGTEILLSQKNGGDGTQYEMTCFTGNLADPLITSGSPPFNSTYRPEEQLGILNNGTIQADGIWKLKIVDDFSFFNGTLHLFSLTFSNNPAVIPSAPNDDCSQAINIAVNTNYNCTLKTTGNIVDANPSPNIPACNIPTLNFDDDIWFSFTANTSAQDFEINNINGTTTELIYQVLEGNCQALTEVFCDAGVSNNFSINNLIAGNQYFLRIASKTEDPNQNISFDICIKEGIPDPPANDECSGAIEIPNTGGCIPVAGTIAGATASTQSQSCPDAGNFSNDVWFYFVANQANMQIQVSNIIGITRDLDFQISHGICTNLVQDFCFFEGNPGATIIIAANNLTINETYYLRVASFNSAPKNTSFNICLDIPASPPVNDECAGAIDIIPDPTNCALTPGTLSGATGSMPGFNCDVNIEDYFDDDVWFKFTATQTAHGVNIYNIVGSSQDLIYEVLGGSCGSFTSVKCQDDPNDHISLDGLTIGLTYYIRIASYLDLVQNTTFDICIGQNNLLVTSTMNDGEGSLRTAVLNASSGDTIKFASDINNATILLDSPIIITGKDLVFHNDYGNQIKIGNSNTNNIDFLLDIRSQLEIEGLQLVSNPTGAMKLKITSSGDLRIYQEQ